MFYRLLAGNFLPVLALAACLGSSCAIGRPPARVPPMSAGAAMVQRMTFAPLQLAVPRVGREVQRRVLPNGLILYLAEDHSLPILDAYAVFRAGSLYEDSGHPGTARFTASQLRNGGTQQYPAAILNEELEVLGASIETSASEEAISISLSALAKDTDYALHLFAEVIRQPAFAEGQLQVSKGRVVEDLRRLADNPPQVLAREFARTLYTEAHPLGRPLTPAQVEALQPGHLREHYVRFFHPNNLMLAVVGDFYTEEMAAKIGALFGDWPSSPIDPPPLPQVQPHLLRGVYIISRPLAQASLTLGHFGINRFNPDRYAIEMMDAILGGGGFASRIMERVRTEEGLAYSVGTAFPTSTRDISLFRATAQTKNENVPRTVTAIVEEMRRIQHQPVSQNELDRARDAFINSFVFRFTSRSGIVRQLLMLEFNGYPADYLDTLLDRYRSVTVADVQRVAKEYLRPDAATIFIIGDPAKFESAMQSFGPVHRLTLESPG